MLARAGLYFRTARHIPLAQLLYFIARRWWPRATADRGRPLQTQLSLPTPVQLRCAFAPPESCIVNDRFCFLARTSPFTITDIDWSSAGLPKLWRYHLHYFDWLRQPGLDAAWLGASVSHWIDHNPVGRGEGWEPYTVSLRLVNWIRFLNARLMAGESIEPRWLQSLEQQGQWLNCNLEHHIRANHLLKNLVAMVWFCVFMRRQPEYQNWLSRYCDLLQAELIEQFNADGGHYERSPMYHAIALEDCIGLYDLLQAADVRHAVRDRLRSLIPHTIAYLRALSFADGRIALFGDSTLHGALDWHSLHIGWQLLHSTRSWLEEDLAAEDFPAISRLIHLPWSRFAVYATPHYRIVISTGGVSPDYQPGHTHCDMGSFEIATPQGRMITDSGVSEYASGPMRRYVRSSRAHNVVMVDDGEQHELWGEFRVGARGQMDELRVGAMADSSPEAVEVQVRMLSHAASPRAWRNIRTFRLRDDSIEIQDLILVENATSDVAKVESSLHLHPDVQASIQPQGFQLNLGDNTAVRVLVANAESVQLEPAWYCPDFGVALPASRISLRCSCAGSTSLDLRLEFGGREQAATEIS
ncbi:MAG TPA: alginate lyase family protein [Dongiaceae bacterium]|nr:alginate lyase family protein [Dongiaceae bacterium]